MYSKKLLEIRPFSVHAPRHDRGLQGKQLKRNREKCHAEAHHCDRRDSRVGRAADFG
jgi:hypothetical protein